MRGITTAVLAALLAALGGFYYVWEVRLGPGREKTAAAKGRLFTVEAADVAGMTLTRGPEVVRLVRDGDGWRIGAPVAARGDKAKVDETLTAIVTARIDREIADKPGAVAEWGLDKPAAVVELRLKDGRTLGLELGAKSVTGTWVFARERGKPAVVALGENVLKDVQRPVAELRDRTVLAFERREVTGLEIAPPGADPLAVTTVVSSATSPAAGRWTLERPVKRAGDGETIVGFLDKLQAARVSDFVTEETRGLERWGLDRPTRVTVRSGTGAAAATRTLLVGRADPARKGVYAKRADEPSVFVLADDVAGALPRSAAALRSKTVVDVPRDRLTRLRVEGPKGRVVLARDAASDQWRVTEPEAVAADQAEVAALLTRLAGLRAIVFAGEDAAAVARYLARPSVRVEFATAGAPPTVVLLGAAGSVGGKPAAFAAVAGQGPVAVVDGSAPGELGKSLDEIRDRTLLAGFEPRDVHRIRIRSGSGSALLERAGPSDWTLLEPSRGAASSARVEDLLYALRGLRWHERRTGAGLDRAGLGLAAPALEIGLYRQDGTEFATVARGRREGERVWLATGRQLGDLAGREAAAYAVDAKPLGEVPKVPDDFRR